MNPLRTIAATALVLGFSGPAQSQSDPDPDASGSIQSTLGEFAANAFEDAGTLYQNAIRHYWLRTSDIRMIMKAHDEGTGTTDYGDVIEERGGPWDLFAFSQEASDASLYAEFDWDNRAMSMRAKDSGSRGYAEFVPFAERIDTSSEATDVTMYFDAAGNVYVPTGNGRYTSVNFADAIGAAFGTLAFGIEAAVDLRAAEMMDALAATSVIVFDEFNPLTGLFDQFLSEGVRDLLSEYQPTYIEGEGWTYNRDGGVQTRLRQMFLNLSFARYEILTNYPLVNFAFIFSPALVRNYDNIREEPTTWAGRGGATKFTVTSGSDAGYVIIFDGAGRLVLLRDTDGSTAEYMYDRDVSVP